MPLDVTPVYRNLRTRVTFAGLEAEDLFAILAVAVVMNIFGRFLNREMFGLPMNMVLQYRRIGPWRDYLVGERTYLLLSLTAKSLLAWLIFANVLRS